MCINQIGYTCCVYDSHKNYRSISNLEDGIIHFDNLITCDSRPTQFICLHWVVPPYYTEQKTAHKQLHRSTRANKAVNEIFIYRISITLSSKLAAGEFTRI